MYSFLKTIGAIKKVTVVNQEVLIQLYKIADITTLIRFFVCLKSGQNNMTPKTLAKIIHEEANRHGQTFSGILYQIRMNFEIRFPFTEKKPSSIILFHYEDEEKKFEFELE